MTMVAWRANEFEFYSTILDNVKTIESRLATSSGSIEFILQRSEGAVLLQVLVRPLICFLEFCLSLDGGWWFWPFLDSFFIPR